MSFQISLIGILVTICVHLQRLCPGQILFFYSVADLPLHSTLVKGSQGWARFLGTRGDFPCFSLLQERMSECN